MKDKKTYTAKEVGDLFARFLGDPPCDYNDNDERTIDDMWCEMYCGKVSDAECWEHALKEGWLK